MLYVFLALVTFIALPRILLLFSELVIDIGEAVCEFIEECIGSWRELLTKWFKVKSNKE